MDSVPGEFSRHFQQQTVILNAALDVLHGLFIVAGGVIHEAESQRQASWDVLRDESSALLVCRMLTMDDLSFHCVSLWFNGPNNYRPLRKGASLGVIPTGKLTHILQ